MVAVFLVVSMPLGLISLTVYFIALYLAKLPAALWLGGRLLSLAGAPNASP